MFESHAEIVRLSMAGTWICLGLVALLTNLAYRNKKVLLALLTSVLIGAGVVAGYLGSSLITTDSIKVIMAFMLATRKCDQHHARERFGDDSCNRRLSFRRLYKCHDRRKY